MNSFGAPETLEGFILVKEKKKPLMRTKPYLIVGVLVETVSSFFLVLSSFLKSSDTKVIYTGVCHY